MEDSLIKKQQTALPPSTDEHVLIHTEPVIDSSLALRRLPVDIVLIPPEPSIEEQTVVEENNNNTDHFLLRKLCINSKFSLKMQLILTFGTVNTLTILLVAALCILVAMLSGDYVKNITNSNYDTLARESEGKTARYLAEALSPQLIPKDIVEIINNAVQERFAGYPDYPGDELVPFWDIESESNKYPLVGEPLPLDWEIEPNVNDANYMEHVQGRWSWYNNDISTGIATYYMQGMCDPSVTDPSIITYYPNCTEDNNDIKAGGVVAPTPSNYQVHRKASDLTPLFKTIYEYHQELYSLGVYFANGGSGATMYYPHMELDGTIQYESIGCNWLVDTPNPFDNTRSLLANSPSWNNNRTCRPLGTTVPSRDYNPLERGWCRDQAINPHKIHVIGPYVAAWPEDILFVTVGRAIYDKVTSEFIGCISVDFIFGSFEHVLESSRLTTNAEVSVVRYDDGGTILASTAWNVSTATTTTTIDEINAGVSKDVYKSLWSLVNYSNYANDERAIWNATHISEIYENFVYNDEENGRLVAGYPIPPPPDAYDPEYVPEFMAIVSVPTVEVYKEVDFLMDRVDDEVQKVVYLSITIAVVGVCIIGTSIILASYMLTSPLQYMNKVAHDIINNNLEDYQTRNDDDSSRGTSEKVGDNKQIDANNIKTYANAIKQHDHHYKGFEQWKYVPRTELNDVVEKFKEMVSHFTGGSMAKSMKVEERELKNVFPLVNEYKQLYLSRQEERETLKKEAQFPYNFYPTICNDSLELLHFGYNTNHNDTGQTSGGSSFTTGCFIEEKKGRSSLFLWIVALMVMPCLLNTTSMTAVVATTSFYELSGIIDEIKDTFVTFKVNALNINARHRAHLTSVLMGQPIRDLHVLTRYAEWLLSNGINRTDSFSEVTSNIDECRKFSDLMQCAEFIEAPICDCAWGDMRGTCQNYTTIDSRPLQKLFFISQSQDTWPNGDRNSTSYPSVSTSSQTTEWWNDVTTLPGSSEGSLASGHDTTYARVRGLSALPVLQLLFNKDAGSSKVHLGSYIGYEADGTFMGYEGCGNPSHESLSHFSLSSADEDLRPEICPAGKYGYDPRCRKWYDYGKDLYTRNESNLYVTPPYKFAGKHFTGQSATAPLVDTTTGEYIGQSLVDFDITTVISSFSGKQSQWNFPFLIAASADMNDTVLGPGFSPEDPKPIEAVLYAHDPVCIENMNCTNRQEFQLIVNQMKAGKNENAVFSRTNADGFKENFYVAYAPVIVNSFSPVDSSDFSRGVQQSEHIIFSLAIAENEESLLLQLYEMQQHLNLVIIISMVIMITVFCIASSFVIYLSYRLALSISEPMLYLSDLMGYINRLETHCDTPDIDPIRRGHSLEVVNVSKTIESLYNIILSANVDYFAGNIQQAYSVLLDVLKVYRGLHNEKGISIACNNLGNTMLAMYRTLEDEEEDVVCGFTKKKIIAMGLRYFHEAIQLGEKAYDAFYQAQGWSPICLEFMQHLSNRYFNRAMFLLTIKDSHEKPKEIEELGLRDLQIAQDMDMEIVAEGTQAGWEILTLDTLFNVTLSRLRGHIELLEMGYPDVHEVEEILDDAFKTIESELRDPTGSILFRGMSPAGRMQQIETELMRYKMLKNDITAAAKIAIRMFVEDEYILVEAQRKGLEVLESYMNLPKSEEEKDSIGAQLARTSLFLQKYKDQLEESDEILTDKSLSASVRTSKCRRNSSRGDVTMETF